MEKSCDVIIIGAGAAGLYCAMQADGKGLRSAVVDHADKAGKKVRIAGGGMGNVTNRILSSDHYVGADCSVLRGLFREFDTNAVLQLLSECHIPFEEREFGQIFCLKPASALVEALLSRCRSTEFFFGHKIDRIYYDRQEDGSYLYHLYVGDTHLAAPQLVIATGSSACPQVGASDFGLRLAKKWGFSCTEFQPVLAPFIMPDDWPLAGLEGISLPVRLRILRSEYSPAFNGKAEFKDPCDARSMLFTHRGISGPAVLAISCFWAPSDQLVIDFLPHVSFLELMNLPENGKKLVRNLLLSCLPDRLAWRILPPDLERRKVAELSKKDRKRLCDAVHAHTVVPVATEGLAKAEAARGGVALSSLSQNFEAFPGLFFCGEVLDVTGLLGGYNIHFALASAARVGKVLRKK